MGRPKQFDSLRQRLEDCDAELLSHVLPGHEADLEVFLKTNGDAWQKSVSELVDSLRETHDRIILIGHSMGGNIAVREAVRNPEKISRVIAIGFPIKVSVGPAWIRLNMLASRPAKAGEDARVAAARSMAGVKICGVGDYLRTLPNNIEFLRLTKNARNMLPRLSVPLTVINFKKDEIVSKGVRDFVTKALPETSFYLLENSYHFLFTPEETELMADLIRSEIEKESV